MQRRGVPGPRPTQATRVETPVAETRTRLGNDAWYGRVGWNDPASAARVRQNAGAWRGLGRGGMLYGDQCRMDEDGKRCSEQERDEGPWCDAELHGLSLGWSWADSPTSNDFYSQKCSMAGHELLPAENTLSFT
jgi:hypothetical protein